MSVRVTVFLMATALAAASGAVARADARVKPGVWEWRVSTTISEVRTSFPEAGQVPADERDKVEAATRLPVVAPAQVSTERKCVTPAMAHDWTALTNLNNAFGECRRKTLAQTTGTYRVSLVCSPSRVTGTIDFAAAPESISGETRIVRHESGYDRIDKTQVEASRIDSVCPKPADSRNATERSRSP